MLRVAAPLLALVIGAGFTRLVARARSRIDGEREFDRGGKALFMGFAMVAATIVAWLLVSQAIPATLTAFMGAPGSEPGIVSHRVAETSDADCRFRLVVASAATDGGAVPRPLDECVDRGRVGAGHRRRPGDAASATLRAGRGTGGRRGPLTQAPNGAVEWQSAPIGPIPRVSPGPCLEIVIKAS